MDQRLGVVPVRIVAHYKSLPFFFFFFFFKLKTTIFKIVKITKITLRHYEMYSTKCNVYLQSTSVGGLASGDRVLVRVNGKVLNLRSSHLHAVGYFIVALDSAVG